MLGLGDSLRVVSWNVNGLNQPEKRTMVLREINRLKAHIGFLQETHFRADRVPCLRDRKYPLTYHACATDTKTKGVSMIIGKNIPWTFIDKWSDNMAPLLLRGS